MAQKRRTYRVVRSDSVEALESTINNQYLADPETYPNVEFHGGMGMEYIYHSFQLTEVDRYHQTISFDKDRS